MDVFCLVKQEQTGIARFSQLSLFPVLLLLFFILFCSLGFVRTPFIGSMDNFQTVLRFFMNQKATIGYSFMALLTIGGERVFSMVSFQCPCNRDQNFAYGLVFLLGPAAVLLILGLFFSTRLWRLYTGCCLNPMKLCPRGNCLGCLRAFMSIFTGACVAPIMWLSVALLNGTFYECAVSGLDNNLVTKVFCKNKTVLCREELAQVPCDRFKLSAAERMELLLMFRAQSQVRHTPEGLTNHREACFSSCVQFVDVYLEKLC